MTFRSLHKVIFEGPNGDWVLLQDTVIGAPEMYFCSILNGALVSFLSSTRILSLWKNFQLELISHVAEFLPWLHPLYSRCMPFISFSSIFLLSVNLYSKALLVNQCVNATSVWDLAILISLFTSWSVLC